MAHLSGPSAEEEREFAARRLVLGAYEDTPEFKEQMGRTTAALLDAEQKVQEVVSGKSSASSEPTVPAGPAPQPVATPARKPSGAHFI